MESKSIQLLRDYITYNKEKIIYDITGKWLHYEYAYGFEELPEDILAEESVGPDILIPIVKEILGINTISVFANTSVCERLDIGGENIRNYNTKTLHIIRIK